MPSEIRCRRCGEKVNRDMYCSACGALYEPDSFSKQVKKAMIVVVVFLIIVPTVFMIFSSIMEKKKQEAELINRTEMTYIYANDMLFCESGMMSAAEYKRIPQEDMTVIGVTNEADEMPLTENGTSYKLESGKEIIYHEKEKKLYISYEPEGTDYKGYLVYE